MKNEFWDHVEKVRTQPMREGWNYVIGLYFKQAWKDLDAWWADMEEKEKSTGVYRPTYIYEMYETRHARLVEEQNDWIAQCQQ